MSAQTGVEAVHDALAGCITSVEEEFDIRMTKMGNELDSVMVSVDIELELIMAAMSRQTPASDEM